jgi:hypothetical protein
MVVEQTAGKPKVSAWWYTLGLGLIVFGLGGSAYLFSQSEMMHMVREFGSWDEIPLNVPTERELRLPGGGRYLLRLDISGDSEIGPLDPDAPQARMMRSVAEAVRWDITDPESGRKIECVPAGEGAYHYATRLRGSWERATLKSGKTSRVRIRTWLDRSSLPRGGDELTEIGEVEFRIGYDEIASVEAGYDAVEHRGLPSGMVVPSEETVTLPCEGHYFLMVSVCPYALGVGDTFEDSPPLLRHVAEAVRWEFRTVDGNELVETDPVRPEDDPWVFVTPNLLTIDWAKVDFQDTRDVKVRLWVDEQALPEGGREMEQIESIQAELEKSVPEFEPGYGQDVHFVWACMVLNLTWGGLIVCVVTRQRRWKSPVPTRSPGEPPPVPTSHRQA